MTSHPNPALPYPPSFPPPGFLHTPDGGHPAPTISRHSPAVFFAPWAGRWGGSAHPPGAHSHSAGKAMMTSLKKDLHTHTPSTTNNSIFLLPLSFHLFALPLCHMYGACFKRYLMSSLFCFHIQTSQLVNDYFCQEFNGLLSPLSFFFWFIFFHCCIKSE